MSGIFSRCPNDPQWWGSKAGFNTEWGKLGDFFDRVIPSRSVDDPCTNTHDLFHNCYIQEQGAVGRGGSTNFSPVTPPPGLWITLGQNLPILLF